MSSSGCSTLINCFPRPVAFFALLLLVFPLLLGIFADISAASDLVTGVSMSDGGDLVFRDFKNNSVKLGDIAQLIQTVIEQQQVMETVTSRLMRAEQSLSSATLLPPLRVNGTWGHFPVFNSGESKRCMELRLQAHPRQLHGIVCFVSSIVISHHGRMVRP